MTELNVIVGAGMDNSLLKKRSAGDGVESFVVTPTKSKIQVFSPFASATPGRIGYINFPLEEETEKEKGNCSPVIYFPTSNEDSDEEKEEEEEEKEEEKGEEEKENERIVALALRKILDKYCWFIDPGIMTAIECDMMSYIQSVMKN